MRSALVTPDAIPIGVHQRHHGKKAEACPRQRCPRRPAPDPPPTAAAEPARTALLARLAELPAEHPQRHRLREQVIEFNLPYAHLLAAQFSHCGEPRDDLNQVAALALTLAVDRYDPARGTAFRTYATPTILGELRRHLRDTGWGVHVPRPLQELALQIKNAEAEVTNRLRRTATPADLASTLHITQ